MAQQANSDKRRGAPGAKRKFQQKVLFSRRARSCPLSGPQAPKIDYKDAKLLLRFISETGKIIPSRISGVCAKKQRELAVAIKRAREMAIIPYIS